MKHAHLCAGARIPKDGTVILAAGDNPAAFGPKSGAVDRKRRAQAQRGVAASQIDHGHVAVVELVAQPSTVVTQDRDIGISRFQSGHDAAGAETGDWFAGFIRDQRQWAEHGRLIVTAGQDGLPVGHEPGHARLSRFQLHRIPALQVNPMQTGPQRSHQQGPSIGAEVGHGGGTVDLIARRDEPVTARGVNLPKPPARGGAIHKAPPVLAEPNPFTPIRGQQ